MIMPASCSSGLRSRPSATAGSRRANGLLVKIRKARKPKLMMPITPSTRAMTSSGRDFENHATAPVHVASTSTHNSSEPSCAPQTAV